MTYYQALALALMSAMLSTCMQSDVEGWKSLVLTFCTILFCRFVWWLFVDRKSA